MAPNSFAAFIEYRCTKICIYSYAPSDIYVIFIDYKFIVAGTLMMTAVRQFGGKSSSS